MMKKILLLLVVMVATVSASAQVYVGGSVGFWDNDDNDFTNFSIAPEVGYALNDKWDIGAELGYMHNKVGDNSKLNVYYLSPYARYSYFESGIVRLFVDGSVGYSHYKQKGSSSDSGFEIGLKPGLALKLTDRFSLVSRFGFVGYRNDFNPTEATGNGFGLGLLGSDLTFGLIVNF